MRKCFLQSSFGALALTGNFTATAQGQKTPEIKFDFEEETVGSQPKSLSSDRGQFLHRQRRQQQGARH